MDTRTITLVVAFFLLIVCGMFIFAYLNRSERATDVPQETPAPAVPDLAYPEITRIDAKHFYIDGTHTFVGELTLPTPCDLLEASATVAESYPEIITLDFRVINNAETCVAQLSTQRFLVSASASVDANVQAVFMGRPVTLNLIPAAPGETPDDFELFIKG